MDTNYMKPIRLILNLLLQIKEEVMVNRRDKLLLELMMDQLIIQHKANLQLPRLK